MMSNSFKNIKQQISTFLNGDPNENPWVKSKPIPTNIQIVPYDIDWVNIFAKQKKVIDYQLKELAISIHHIGSTAVQGLSAKPIIDIDLLVENPSDEQSYVPKLEALGFELIVREPSWYQHRMLRLNDPKINLHVFGKHCPEHLRHLLFRNWLINHKDDRELYTQAKISAIVETNDVIEYNKNKNAVVRAIYQRIFTQLDELLPTIITKE